MPRKPPKDTPTWRSQGPIPPQKKKRKKNKRQSPPPSPPPKKKEAKAPPPKKNREKELNKPYKKRPKSPPRVFCPSPFSPRAPKSSFRGPRHQQLRGAEAEEPPRREGPGAVRFFFFFGCWPRADSLGHQKGPEIGPGPFDPVRMKCEKVGRAHQCERPTKD